MARPRQIIARGLNARARDGAANKIYDRSSRGARNGAADVIYDKSSRGGARYGAAKKSTTYCREGRKWRSQKNGDKSSRGARDGAAKRMATNRHEGRAMAQLIKSKNRRDGRLMAQLKESARNGAANKNLRQIVARGARWHSQKNRRQIVAKGAAERICNKSTQGARDGAAKRIGNKCGRAQWGSRQQTNGQQKVVALSAAESVAEAQRRERT